MTATAVFEGVDTSAHLRQLVELWARVDALSALPDAEGLSGNRALESAVAVAHARHALDALLAPYAARLDELSDPSLASRFARWKGFPNAAALLSSETGLSITEAGKLISVGRALADAVEAPLVAPVGLDAGVEAGAPLGDATPFGDAAPANEPGFALAEPESALASVFSSRPEVSPLAAAIRGGRLGTEKITIIRRTLEDMTAHTQVAEALLVDRADGLSLTALRRLCLTTFAELDPQGYADREATQYRDRYLSIREEIDGTVTFYAKLPPSLAAPAKAWFEAEMQSAVSAQRDASADEQRGLGQILADAFVSTVMHAAGCDRATTRPQSTFVVRASKSSLESGRGLATCDGIEAPMTIAAVLAVAADVQFADS